MLIPLKLVRDKPLQQQLYEQLRDLIGAARLIAGTRMPSTRMLADQFSISRITVLLTYERLIAEGYLRTEPAKGTFVNRVPAAERAPHHTPELRLNGEPLLEPRVGRPDPRLFPAGRWRALVRSALDHPGASLHEEHPDGDPVLRQAIARWLSTSRGLAADPDQIILASGRQHALHVATHMLLRPGVRAIIESPSDPRTERLLASTGATIEHVPVDEDGMQVERLSDEAAAMVIVTPEHQRPLGVAMSADRRHELLAWADRTGAVIFAEDSDGELRYGAMDAPLLMNLDTNGIVIHAGDFAASLGPAIKLGYLVVPRRLIPQARSVSRLIGDLAGRLESAALSTLLESGGYARHLHHLRKIYLARRDTLIRALRRNFGEDTRIGGTTAGLHLTWAPPSYLGHTDSLADTARRVGLEAARAGDRAVLMGFGILAEPQIETGINRLAAALRNADFASADMAAMSGD